MLAHASRTNERRLSSEEPLRIDRADLDHHRTQADCNPKRCLMNEVTLLWPPRVAVTDNDDLEIEFRLSAGADVKWQLHFMRSLDDHYPFVENLDVTFSTNGRRIGVRPIQAAIMPDLMAAIRAALATANGQRRAEREPAEKEAQAVVDSLEATWGP
jgi:hypothetical protein